MFRFSDTSGNGLLRLWPQLVQAAFQRLIQRALRPQARLDGCGSAGEARSRSGRGSLGMSGGFILGGLSREIFISVTHCLLSPCKPNSQTWSHLVEVGPRLLTLTCTSRLYHSLTLRYQTWSQVSDVNMGWHSIFLLERRTDIFSMYSLWGHDEGEMWEGTSQANARTAVSSKSYQSQGLVPFPAVLPQDHDKIELHWFKSWLSRRALWVKPICLPKDSVEIAIALMNYCLFEACCDWVLGGMWGK